MKTIYCNGRVYTGKLPLVQAFAVEGDKFLLAGSDEQVLAQRRAKWVRPPQKYKKGYLALYEKCAASASRGAGIEI